MDAGFAVTPLLNEDGMFGVGFCELVHIPSIF
jgi:hypothetical protein